MLFKLIAFRLHNSNIYLKLHSILTLLFKSLRLLEFIFEVIFYIERVKFLSNHSIQHYCRSKYSLQVSFNFQKTFFVQVVHLNNISDRNTLLNLNRVIYKLSLQATFYIEQYS
ncbi:unnamed protein product [Rotaria socialis]